MRQNIKIHSIIVSIVILISALLPAHAATSADSESQPTTIAWQEYSDTIYETAKHEQRLILVYGKAGWCKWCKKFSKTTLTDATVVDLINQHFVPALLDIDTNRDAAIKFSIAELPTILILDSNRRVIKETHGYLTVDETKEFLELVIKENPLEAIKKN